MDIFTNNKDGVNMLRPFNNASNQELKPFSLRNLRLRRELSAFHEEEHGASGSIDNVMLIFVAALILIGLITLVNGNVWSQVTGKISELFGSSIGN